MHRSALFLMTLTAIACVTKDATDDEDTEDTDETPDTDDASNEEVTSFEEFVAAFAQENCRLNFECELGLGTVEGVFTDEAECIEYYSTEVPVCENFDVDLANACLAALNSLTCDDLDADTSACGGVCDWPADTGDSGDTGGGGGAR